MEIIFFGEKNDMYMNFFGATHVYKSCIDVRSRTSKKILFFEESKGGKGDWCLQVGQGKGQQSNQCFNSGNWCYKTYH